MDSVIKQMVKAEVAAALKEREVSSNVESGGASSSCETKPKSKRSANVASRLSGLLTKINRKSEPSNKKEMKIQVYNVLNIHLYLLVHFPTGILSCGSILLMLMILFGVF